MRIKVPKTLSWQWKSMLGGRDLIQKGACRRISRVVGCDVWEDFWIPTISGFKQKSNHASHCQINWVLNLKTLDTISATKLMKVHLPIVKKSNICTYN